MSATEFYLNKGFTPLTQTAVLNTTNTISVWVSKAGHRVAITNLAFSSDPVGTLTFYWDNGNNAIATYHLFGSVSLTPSIGCWDSTVSGGRIFARASAAQSTGGFINLTGFEIPVTAV